jgi:hypothetical protein
MENSIGFLENFVKTNFPTLVKIEITVAGLRKARI